jgi:hypothetical protein
MLTNITLMKNNPIIIIKHAEHIKKRSEPTDLKRKIGLMPTQISNQSYSSKL